MRNAALDQPRFEPVLVYAATPGRAPVRWALMATLGLSPLAIGSGYWPAYTPLLIVVFAAGLFSILRTRHLRGSGVVMPDVPGARALFFLVLLVGVQLVPLPPTLLRWISPGSFAFYNDPRLLPLTEWRPITASPADTLRGLIFLAGMGMLYASVYREFDHPVWRRRLAKTVVGVAFVMTVEALIQEAYAAGVIYGVWRPRWDWAVFGPYVNRNLFAGYMLMAVPLAVALSAEYLEDLRRAWRRRRRRGWLALGDAEASAFLRWASVAMALLVGLLATRSRGAMLGLLVWALVLPLVSPRRRIAAFATVLVLLLGVSWVGLEGQWRTFQARGIGDAPRMLIWRDSVRLIPMHPLLGSGFNAFGTALPPRQRAFPTEWIGTTHDEYLQVLVDLGLAGFVTMLVLIAVLARASYRAARQGTFQAGLLASLAAILAQNLVDANWQLPANAATFAALAGLATQAPLPPRTEAHPSPRRETRR